MFAVIKTGGKQYLVEKGTKLKVEKLTGEAGAKVSFDEVLMTFSDSKTDIGTPVLSGVKVEGEIVQQGRAKKITNLRFHSKTRHRRKKGHRQHFTEVEIIRIQK